MKEWTLLYKAFQGILLLVFIFPVMPVFSQPVPVIPSELLVEGKVLEYSILSSQLIDIQPHQTLYRVTIRIKSVKCSTDRPCFTRLKTGDIEQFYSKQRLSQKLYKKNVRAIVKYAGDERGGRFWIKDIKIIQ